MDTSPAVPAEPPRGFVEHALAEGIPIYLGRLPAELVPDAAGFDALWQMHPPHRDEVILGSGTKHPPRWHQAYGRDYEFAGYSNRALPVPAALQGLLDWSMRAVDPRMNGVLVNWYDAEQEHRIAQHKDSPIGRVVGSPILTISLGAARTFRMWVRRQWVEFRVVDGDVVFLPDATNREFAHAVPHLPGDQGRRISVTIRAFVVEVGGP